MSDAVYGLRVGFVFLALITLYFPHAPRIELVT
jgi:hypothetical protein